MLSSEQRRQCVTSVRWAVKVAVSAGCVSLSTGGRSRWWGGGRVVRVVREESEEGGHGAGGVRWQVGWYVLQADMDRLLGSCDLGLVTTKDGWPILLISIVV